MRGIDAGLKEVLRLPDKIPVFHIDADGQFKTALEVVRKHLRASQSQEDSGRSCERRQCTGRLAGV